MAAKRCVKAAPLYLNRNKGTPMAAPLSPATRAIKRNLLIAAVLGIAANAFKVSIDKIPLAGLSIAFDGRLFSFLLCVTLVYFLIVFVIYYTIDIKNLQETEHQKSSETRYKQWKGTFDHNYISAISDKLQNSISLGHNVTLQHDWSIEDYLVHDKLPVRILKKSTGPLTPSAWITREDQPDVYEKPDAIFVSSMNSYKRRLMLGRVRAFAPRWGTKFLYFARNYILDGLLPIALAASAILAVMGTVDFHWIARIVPDATVLGPNLASEVLH